MERNSLNIGDRVLLNIDNAKNYGWVRWLTTSNDKDKFVGVELENPVGPDNHIINGRYLFDVPHRHGILLPLSRLIKVENVMYDDDQSKDINIKRISKKYCDTPLGQDLSHMSTFHQMAYDQLTDDKIKTKDQQEENRETLPHVLHRTDHSLKPEYSQNKYSSNTKIENQGEIKNKIESNCGCCEKQQTLQHRDQIDDIRNRSRGYGDSVDRVHRREQNNSISSDMILKDSPQSYLSRGINQELNNLNSLNDSHFHNGIPLTDKNKPSYYFGMNNISSADTVENDRETKVNNTVENSKEYYDISSNFHSLALHSKNGIDQVEILYSNISNDGLNFECSELGVGSMVEIDPDIEKESERFKSLHGVIRWIGVIPWYDDERLIAGIETEDIEGLSDGTLKQKRYFNCPIGKGIFVPLDFCIKDRRFLESILVNPRASLAFGSLDCQPVMGNLPPLTNIEEIKSMFGRNKGIQGHQNSCYLDATLFSMFAFTSVFDTILFRPRFQSDIEKYSEVQSVLRDEIVNPLRKNMFVRADRIMKLRTLLESLSSVAGLTTEEKDAEEFLNSLLAQILKAEPFLQLSSGQESYFYQLFVEKDDRLSLPSVQNLFDQSFLASDIKLNQIPSCLIIQMPRFGKDYKMYPRILPSMLLDITDVLDDSPRQCIICGKLAELECVECFGECGTGLESISFCAKCMEKAHCHKKRGSHQKMRKLKIPPEFEMLAEHCGTIPRVYMELFAVVCIETSHYVSFTRCGSGPEAIWCFFDSMADRKGEQHGYNIPTVTECSDLMKWVGEEFTNDVTDNKLLPDLPRRLLCDAYMCFYQSPKVMMYR